MRLFLSYSHKDTDKAARLADLLAQGGHAVFWDDALQAGRQWRDQLAQEIEAADGLVYALSPDAVASAWCQFEFTHAIRHGKTIIPVKIVPMDDADLPPVISAYQYADLTRFSADAVAKLLGDLGRFSALPVDAAPALADPVGLPERALAQFGDVTDSHVAVADRGGVALSAGGNIYHADHGSNLSVGIGTVGLIGVALMIALIVAILVLGGQ